MVTSQLQVYGSLPRYRTAAGPHTPAPLTYPALLSPPWCTLQVAVHIPESIKKGNPAYRTNRDKTKELTAEGAEIFWPQHTGDGFLPNPSATCTWNVTAPPSPTPLREYPKSIHTFSPREQLDTQGDGLVSASQVEASFGGGSSAAG